MFVKLWIPLATVPAIVHYRPRPFPGHWPGHQSLGATMVRRVRDTKLETRGTRRQVHGWFASPTAPVATRLRRLARPMILRKPTAKTFSTFGKRRIAHALSPPLSPGSEALVTPPTAGRRRSPALLTDTKQTSRSAAAMRAM